jgi:hypothetical protein
VSVLPLGVGWGRVGEGQRLLWLAAAFLLLLLLLEGVGTWQRGEYPAAHGFCAGEGGEQGRAGSGVRPTLLPAQALVCCGLLCVLLLLSRWF